MAAAPLAPQTIVSRSDQAIAEQLGQETVILDPLEGRYVRLNRTGTIVWQALDEPREVGSLVRLVADRFDLADGRAEADVAAFLETLAGRGMVTMSAPPPST